MEAGWVETFLLLEAEKIGRVPEASEYFTSIYPNAFYFILTTITTVGYGDITGSTSAEYVFSMFVEFIGLTFFSLLTGTISVMFSSD